MLSRRQFLQGTALVAISAAVPPAAKPTFIGWDLGDGQDMSAVAIIQRHPQFKLYRYQEEAIRWLDQRIQTQRAFTRSGFQVGRVEGFTFTTIQKPRSRGNSPMHNW